MKDMDVSIIWDYLKKDKEYKDRRMTEWGSKTKVGLSECLKRLYEEAQV